jgi:2-methylcitrate dehydratase
MDKNSRAIAEFAAAHRFEDIRPAAVAATIRHHLDGLGCAAGGFASEPVIIARDIAGMVTMAGGCTVFGLDRPSTPEYAAFANGCAVRHLDYNDTYLAGKGGGGHPNDMAPAIFAAVEMTGGGGRELINGIYIGYEIFGAICNAIRLRGKGIDQGASIGIATAAAVGRILGLDAKGIATAVALAIVPSTPVRVSRAGELSHWKGCATAHAAMTGMFAARLAKAGMSGPDEPFTGVDGFCNLSGPFTLKDIGAHDGGPSAIEDTAFKFFPSEFNSQGPITLLLEMRREFDPADIVALRIASYHLTWHEIGGGQGDRPEKWDPRTRESADHSLPFLAAVALLDGAVTLDSFAAARIADPALRPLMQRIEVVEDAAYSAHWKATSEPRNRIEVTLKDGRTLTREVTNFRGHQRNPMSDAEVRAKFDSMIGYVLPPEPARRFADRLWALDRERTLDALAADLRAWRVLRSVR